MIYPQRVKSRVSINPLLVKNLYIKIIVARPRKLKKPIRSVNVVKTTLLPIAGSTLYLLSSRSTTEPKKTST
jgi:hypothetical protein